jgi:hypothetical protein
MITQMAEAMAVDRLAQRSTATQGLVNTLRTTETGTAFSTALSRGDLSMLSKE